MGRFNTPHLHLRGGHFAAHAPHIGGGHRPRGHAILHRHLATAHPASHHYSVPKPRHHHVDVPATAPHPTHDHVDVPAHKPFEAFPAEFEGFINQTASVAHVAGLDHFQTPGEKFDVAAFTGDGSFVNVPLPDKDERATRKEHYNDLQAALAAHEKGPKPDLYLTEHDKKHNHKTPWNDVADRIRNTDDFRAKLKIANDAINSTEAYGGSYTATAGQPGSKWLSTPYDAIHRKNKKFEHAICGDIAFAKIALLHDAGIDLRDMQLVTLPKKGGHNAHVIAIITQHKPDGSTVKYGLEMNHADGTRGYVFSANDPKTKAVDPYDTRTRLKNASRIIPAHKSTDITLAIGAIDAQVTSFGIAIDKNIRGGIANASAALDQIGKDVDKGAKELQREVNEFFNGSRNRSRHHHAAAPVDAPKPAMDSAKPKPQDKSVPQFASHTFAAQVGPGN